MYSMHTPCGSSLVVMGNTREIIGAQRFTTQKNDGQVIQ